MRPAALLCAVLACSGPVHAAAPANVALHDELVAMATRDQAVRSAGTRGDFSQWRAVDDANRARLKQIVAQSGWPTFAMVGEDGAAAAWLMVQHADHDPAFQQEALALMAPLVESEQASGKHYAYLYDRTHYPQRFGTQGDCVSATAWQPFEIEDIAHVDERRLALGMPTMAAYALRFRELCGTPATALHQSSDPRRTVPVPVPGAAAEDFM